MAKSYYNGKEVLNHVLGNKGYAKAYANGKIAIDHKAVFTVSASVSNFSDTHIDIKLSANAASNVMVYVSSSFTAYFNNMETGETIAESYNGYVANASILKGSMEGVASVSFRIPSNCYLMYVRYTVSPTIVGISPSFDAIYNYDIA